MKKFYFLFLSLFMTVFAMAQVTVEQEGNTVTFHFNPNAGTLMNNSGGELDLGGTTPNLYSWIDTDDLVGGDANYAVTGNWPGSAMNDNGDGSWSLTIDLGTLYDAGVQINEINWIINGNGQQTADNQASAIGFTAVTISNMSVNDLRNNANQATAVGSDLYFNQTGNYQVAVYNANGKLMQQFQTNATAGMVKSLNLNEKGIYFVQILNENGEKQNVKVLK